MSSKYFDGQFDNVSFDSQFAGEELRFLDACIDCDDDSLYEIIQNGITWEEVNERDKSGRVSIYLTILKYFHFKLNNLFSKVEHSKHRMASLRVNYMRNRSNDWHSDSFILQLQACDQTDSHKELFLSRSCSTYS